jgi:hypothetical protein
MLSARDAPTFDVIREQRGIVGESYFSEGIVVMSNSERIALFIDGPNLHCNEELGLCHRLQALTV